MTQNNVFGHTGSDGSSPGQRIGQAGYGAMARGESIAAGYASANDGVQGWFGSPGHCAIVMDAKFQDLGGSCVSNANVGYKTCWTADFGRR